MNRSRSTPRIRFTQLLYLAVVVLAAVSDGRALAGPWGTFAQIAGFVLVAVATLGRLWTSLFIAGRKNRELVRDGPYACCRHPLYLLSLVGALGIGLASRSLVLSLALPAALAVVFVRAASAEETLLAGMHGADYRIYAGSVPRFWPDLSLLRVPREVVVPTAIYFKAFLDAASFLLLYSLVVLGDQLTRSGLVPVLLHLH